jgi:hypothetical protein
MDWVLIWAIITSILAVITSVSWLVLYKKVANIISCLKQLRELYLVATEDDVVTNEEKTKAGEILFIVIPELLDVWQSVENFIRAIANILAQKIACKK